jgi:hypothetical protein
MVMRDGGGDTCNLPRAHRIHHESLFMDPEGLELSDRAPFGPDPYHGESDEDDPDIEAIRLEVSVPAVRTEVRVMLVHCGLTTLTVCEHGTAGNGAWGVSGPGVSIGGKVTGPDRLTYQAAVSAALDKAPRIERARLYRQALASSLDDSIDPG